MAASTSLKTIKTEKGTYTVDTYVDNIIGQGAYGIVYKGTDEKGNKIAAKRIDTKRKKGLSERIKDLDKLMELAHPNIVKVHDIHEEEGIVWIFMDLCEHGDLSTFFQKIDLTQEQLLDIMKQIASGIAYLHENNIIHRDIKPGNILVADASEIQVKLTDFDLSKFLDEYFDTSGMSTNVGTLAFKAPEFFQRKPDGTIRYHRTIDNYACGLTYLALLQALGKKKLLLPKIETPRDGSDLTVQSIGQLISERIKYKVPELDIVVVLEQKKHTLMRKLRDFVGVPGGSSDAAAADSSAATTETDTYDLRNEIRKIILNMTRADPEDRWSSAEVVEALQNVEQNMMEARLETIRLEEEKRKRLEEEKRRKEELKRLEEERRKRELKRKFPDMKLDRTSSWGTDMFAFTMCYVGDRLLARGRIVGEIYIRVFNRNDKEVVRNIKSQCDHSYVRNTSICKHPRDNNYVLESCLACKQIRCYNINTDEAQTVYSGSVRVICPGPSGSVLCRDNLACLQQLDMQGEGQEFKVKHSIQTDIIGVRDMCYVEQYNTVVFTCHHPHRIRAVSLSDGSPLWEFKQQVEGEGIYPHGLCHDNDGRIYVANYPNKLLVFAPQAGELLQVLPVDESDLSGVYWKHKLLDVRWVSFPPQLYVLYTGKVSVYNVKY